MAKHLEHPFNLRRFFHRKFIDACFLRAAHINFARNTQLCKQLFGQLCHRCGFRVQNKAGFVKGAGETRHTVGGGMCAARGAVVR